jgi:hypothetical protein
MPASVMFTTVFTLAYLRHLVVPIVLILDFVTGTALYNIMLANNEVDS